MRKAAAVGEPLPANCGGDDLRYVYSGTMVVKGQGVIVALREVGQWRAIPAEEVRALIFAALIVTNFGLIFVNRSFSASVIVGLRRRNPSLWVAIGLTGSLLAVVLVWPPAQSLFRFAPLDAADVALALGAGVAALLALDWLKPVAASRLTADQWSPSV